MTGRASKRAVLIAGPTASGKSALALALAEALGGTIINADSMQVYRDLRIVTARPTAQEEARVPHLLYGHVDAAENYSVGRWCVGASAALAAVERAGRLPVVVGGTGLYFKALTRGLAAVPPIPPQIRAAVRERLALEVMLATGRSLTDWHAEGMKPALDAQAAVKLFLDVERAELYRRIDGRFDAMLGSGALDEVRALASRGLDPALPAMKAHGVPWLIRHLSGEIDLVAAVEGAKRDTRRYSKRQGTWFRHQLPDWTWATPGTALGEIRRALGR